MKNRIGLWIDHRRAVIVFPSQRNEETVVILSQAERHQRRAEGAVTMQPFEAQLVQADDVRQRKFEQQLKAFYDEVIDLVNEADALFVFGPGEAKGEFVKRLAHEKPTPRTVTVKTTDKLTDRQIVAEVHEHFKIDMPMIVLN
jgi:stalled ribosome rescue protein Dom34